MKPVYIYRAIVIMICLSVSSCISSSVKITTTGSSYGGSTTGGIGGGSYSGGSHKWVTLVHTYY